MVKIKGPMALGYSSGNDFKNMLRYVSWPVIVFRNQLKGKFMPKVEAVQ
jgi:hypothetical protein